MIVLNFYLQMHHITRAKSEIAPTPYGAGLYPSLATET